MCTPDTARAFAAHGLVLVPLSGSVGFEWCKAPMPSVYALKEKALPLSKEVCLSGLDVVCSRADKNLLTHTYRRGLAEDVLELLEKCVKSRFSHRQIHLLSSLTFRQYRDAFRSELTLQDDFPDSKFSQEWNLCVSVRHTASRT
ncbi:hypothetical protein KOW79_000043 [Hemibagrus wyckioides]|uniref:Uncharacterized protein n=1 Tax=Hemibagrus wyckioides TaxID=337641 RepID=A0A9D3MZJ4_9TELE|nr:hypothetical protein KOW79_000043 [Hemibagrus wyckioides]